MAEVLLVATAPIIPTSNESPVPRRSPPIAGASVRSKCRASRSSARASRCRRQDLEEVVTSQNRDSHRARSQQPVVQDGNDPPRRAAPRRGRQRHRPRRTRGPRLHHTVGRTVSRPGRGASGNLVAICRSAGRPVTPATPQCERRSEGRPWDVPSRTVLLGDNDEVGGSAPSGGLVTRAAIRVERRPVHQRGRWRKLLRRPRCPARGGLREIRNRRAHPRPLRRRVGHATHRHAVRPALAARPRRRNPRGLAERNGPEQRPWRHLSPTIRSCPDQRSSA